MGARNCQGDRCEWALTDGEVRKEVRVFTLYYNLTLVKGFTKCGISQVGNGEEAWGLLLLVSKYILTPKVSGMLGEGTAWLYPNDGAALEITYRFGVGSLEAKILVKPVRQMAVHKFQPHGLGHVERMHYQNSELVLEIEARLPGSS